MLESLQRAFPADAPLRVRETPDMFLMSGTFHKTTIGIDLLADIFARVPSRDHLTVGITIDHHEISAVSSTNQGEIAPTVIEWNRLLGKAANDPVLELKISKRRDGDSISVYSVAALFETLRTFEIEDQLVAFEKLSGGGLRTSVCCLSDRADFASITFDFSAGKVPIQEKTKERADIVEATRELCNFEQGALFPFVPDDFSFVGSVPPVVTEVTDTLRTLLSIAYISDRSRLSANLFEFWIRGYKLIHGKLDLATTTLDRLGGFGALFTWVFGSRGYSDKIGLARNFLSLGLKEVDPVEMPNWLLNGVRSSYEVYLKKGIGHYLDVKTKIESAVSELTAKALSPAETLVLAFRGNLTGFFAFIVSVVVVTATKQDSLERIFTDPVILLGAGSIALSALYLVLSVVFVYIGMHRVESAYNRLKARYGDVLDPDHLNQILANDQEYSATRWYVKKSFYAVVIVWILMLHCMLLLLLAGKEYDYGVPINPLAYMMWTDVLRWWRDIL